MTPATKEVRAILLLGPTGVGKTPLGEFFEKRGFGGRKCVHFDFGHEMRSIASGNPPPEGFDKEERSFIRDVLDKGLLLENEHFVIAKKIIDFFLHRKSFTARHTLILNGLPRHVAQARDMAAVVDIESLVVLECSADDTYRRIFSNVGGDRTLRVDDGIGMIRRKLEIYRSRTAPLIDYYAEKGCNVFTLRVTSSSATEDVYSSFLSAQPFS